MSKDAFKERERALEEEFFRRVDNKLLADLKQKLAAEAERQRWEATLGADDKELIQEMVGLGISAEAAAAMSLVPLVAVAWADGKLDKKERPAILKAAHERGITEDSPAAELLEHWLNDKPTEELTAAWKHYVTAITKQLGHDRRAALRKATMERARSVAKASGGTLGFNSISVSEEKVLSDLEQAFGD